MAVEEKWIVLFECDRCGNKRAGASTRAEDLPEGFHVHILKVKKRKQRTDRTRTRAQYYCSKDCFIEAIQHHNYDDRDINFVTDEDNE